MKNGLLVCITVLLLAACSSPMQQEEAIITLHFGVAEARAAYPPDAATLAKLEHTITLVGPEGTITRTFAPGVASGNITVVPGVYKITVVAYLVEGSEKVLYASGYKTQNITAGPNNVTVKMYGDESSEGFTFEVIDDGPNKGTARVRANGWLEGDVIIPGYYKDGDNFLPVTEIGSDAFFNSGITNITIPASVTSINNGAFIHCYNLTSITIPASVTSIGEAAFLSCNNLTSIIIPASVMSIGSYAFNWCESLKTITFAQGSQLESIGRYAFSGCINLGAIAIPEGVTLIDDGTFNYCTGLTAITIPASVTELRRYVFDNCEKLASVTFATGSKLETIYYDAFRNCTSLTSITIPASVKKNIDDYYTGIVENPFIGCIKLATITVEAGNPDYSSEGGILYNKDKTELIAYPTVPANFTIPASVTTIGTSAFADCEDLTSVTIPANVTTIGGSAFSYCYNLASVILNTGLERIGGSAFSGCGSLAAITLPAGLRLIEGYAFAYTAITTIAIPESVMYIYNPFVYCENLSTIIVEGTDSRFTAVGGALYEEHIRYDDDGFPVIDENGEPVIEHFLISYPTATGDITTLPSTLTKIGGNAFHGTAITSITLPADVVNIESGAFLFCYYLTSITFPTGLKTIGWNAFGNCVSLTGDITLPAGLEKIDYYAFSTCRNINSITIPASVTYVGRYAFTGWTSSQTINVQGKANQAIADLAWKESESEPETDEYGHVRIYNWRSGCEAAINYAP